jgi:hypothetical protein
MTHNDHQPGMRRTDDADGQASPEPPVLDYWYGPEPRAHEEGIRKMMKEYGLTPDDIHQCHLFGNVSLAILGAVVLFAVMYLLGAL